MQNREESKEIKTSVPDHENIDASKELVAPKKMVALHDGNIALSHDKRNIISIYNPETGQCLKTQEIKSENCLIYLLCRENPGQNHLLISDADGKNAIQVYDAKNNKMLPISSTYPSAIPLPNGTISCLGTERIDFYSSPYTSSSPMASISIHCKQTLSFYPSSSNRFIIGYPNNGNSFCIFDLYKKSSKEWRFCDQNIDTKSYVLSSLRNNEFAYYENWTKKVAIYRINEDNLTLTSNDFLMDENIANIIHVPKTSFAVFRLATNQIILFDLEKREFRDKYLIDPQLGWVTCIDIRPSDGKIVYLTDKFKMGTLHFQAVKDHFAALKMAEVLPKKFLHPRPHLFNIICEYNGNQGENLQLILDSIPSKSKRSACTIS